MYLLYLFFFVLASSALDRGFENQSSQTKDYKIGICCFSAKYAALRSKSKDWLDRNQMALNNNHSPSYLVPEFLIWVTRRVPLVEQTGNTYPSIAHEITPDFWWFLNAQSLIFCVVFYRKLFVFLAIVLSVLPFTAMITTVLLQFLMSISACSIICKIIMPKYIFLAIYKLIMF